MDFNLLKQERKSTRKNPDPVSFVIKNEQVITEIITSDLASAFKSSENDDYMQQPKITERRINQSCKQITSLNKIIDVLRKKLVETNQEHEEGQFIHSSIKQEEIIVKHLTHHYFIDKIVF